MIDNFANFFLKFSHPEVIIPLLAFGYIWIDRKIFYEATILILFSIICNHALKISFQIPLSPWLNKEGFAFPSGHMQSALVLYGWLAFNAKNKIYKFLSILLLIGIGNSLVHFGYHNYTDIFGALFFGLLLLTLYYYLSNTVHNARSIALIIFILASILVYYIHYKHEIIVHIWKAYVSLMSFLLGHCICSQVTENENYIKKIITSISFLVFVFMIKSAGSNSHFNYLSFLLPILQWGMVGFCLPLSPAIGRQTYDFYVRKFHH